MSGFRFGAIKWAIVAFVASTLAASAHPAGDAPARPNDHQHYHCHQSQTCHSHTHDGAHH